MYKLAKREQRIKDLLDSTPGSSASSKNKLHVIDPTYRHPHFSRLGPAQKQILNLTLNDLIDREKRKIEGKLLEEQRLDCLQRHRKLQNYVYSETPTKSLHLHPSPDLNHLTPHLNLRYMLQQNRVYIERKYNHKLCYQLHIIRQATEIEEQVSHIKSQIGSHSSSPLIAQLQKHTQTDVQYYCAVVRGCRRKGHGASLKENKQVGRPGTTQGKLQLLPEGYARSTVPNKSFALKKHTCTSYGTETTKTSPKK